MRSVFCSTRGRAISRILLILASSSLQRGQLDISLRCLWLFVYSWEAVAGAVAAVCELLVAAWVLWVWGGFVRAFVCFAEAVFGCGAFHLLFWPLYSYGWHPEGGEPVYDAGEHVISFVIAFFCGLCGVLLVGLLC